MGGRVLRQAAFSGGRKRRGWDEVERREKFLCIIFYTAF